MPQSLSQVIVHVIYSTKNRVKSIDPPIRGRLHAYLATVLRDAGSYVYRVGGTANHIHAACTLPRTLSQSDLIEKIKPPASKWMKEQGPAYTGFSWQNGYGIFSVSRSRVQKLVDYIDNQEEHHRHKTFKEEFLEFLDKCGVEYDERYLWD